MPDVKHAVRAGSSEAKAQHIWMFQLRLQDATGTLLANVYGPDGDSFFTVEKVLLEALQIMCTLHYQCLGVP